MIEMAKAHGLTKEVVQASRALEDISHTFTPDELRVFKTAYTEAEDPRNHLTDDEMTRLLEQELKNE